MKMLITPRDIIDLVISRKTKDARFRPYETRAQKWLFFSALLAIAAGFVLGMAYRFYPRQVLAVIALSFLGILAVGYQVAAIAPEFRKLKNIEREVSNPFAEEFNHDLDLIHELTGIAEARQLAFAEANFRLMARQLRERISILVGALDKVGIVPLAVTSYLSAQKIHRDGLIAFGGIEWISIALVVLYLFAIRMSATAQWMERVAEIYEHAKKAKEKRAAEEEC